MIINYNLSPQESTFIANLNPSTLQQSKAFLIKAAEDPPSHWKNRTICWSNTNYLEESQDKSHLMSFDLIDTIVRIIFKCEEFSQEQKNTMLQTAQAITGGYGWNRPFDMDNILLTRYERCVAMMILSSNLSEILLNTSYQDPLFWQTHELCEKNNVMIHAFEINARALPRAMPEHLNAVVKHLTSSDKTPLTDKIAIVSAVRTIFHEHGWDLTELNKEIEVLWHQENGVISVPIHLFDLIKMPMLLDQIHEDAEAGESETLHITAPGGTNSEDFSNFINHFLPNDVVASYSLPMPQFCAMINVAHHLGYDDEMTHSLVCNYFLRNILDLKTDSIDIAFKAIDILPHVIGSQLLSRLLTTEYPTLARCEKLKHFEHYETAKQTPCTICNAYNHLPSAKELETIKETFPNATIKIHYNFGRIRDLKIPKPVPEILTLLNTFSYTQISFDSYLVYSQDDLAIIAAIVNGGFLQRVSFNMTSSCTATNKQNAKTIKELYPGAAITLRNPKIPLFSH